jgi:succinoglycan biosynthesis transport protein ExoP
MPESLTTRRALPAPRPPALSGGGSGVEEGAGFKDYLAAVRRHWRVVLAVTAVALGMAVYRNATTEPLYNSVAVLQLEQNQSSPSGGLAGLAATLGGGGSLSSQLEILRSRGILGQVVDSLGLRLQRPVPELWETTYQPTGLLKDVRVAPEAATGTVLELEFGEDGFQVRRGDASLKAAYGAPVEVGGVRFTVPSRPSEQDVLELRVVSREYAVDGLLEHVRPFQRQQTNVVDVVVTGYDPVITQRIANATVERFRLFTTQNARQEATRGRQYVENQLRTTEAAIEEAQARLTEFRKREELYSSRAELVAGQTERGELRLERARLDANRTMYRTIAAELQRSRGENEEALQRLVASPEIAANATIAGLYERLTGLESARDSLISGPEGKSRTAPDIQRMDALIRQTRAQLATAARSQVEWLDARISALDVVEAGIDRNIRQLSGAEPEELRLLAQVESYLEAAKELRERYYTAGIAEAVGQERITLVDPALEGRGTGSGTGRALVFGLLFGVMVGGAGAIALDRLNHSIRRRDEVERLLHVPALAAIPPVAPLAAGRPRLRLPRQLTRRDADRSAAGGEQRLLPAAQVYSQGAEAYRTLRTNLTYGPTGERVKSITVTSPSGSEGKTTTAANLAVSFRQQGRRVLVVDCDFYRARLHEVFGTPASPGLAQLLLGEAAFEEAIRGTAVEGVYLIPAGPLPQVINPADLVGESAMSRVLEVLAGEFDVIVLDTPPVLASASAAVLSAQTDATLLVLRAGRTDRDSAREALAQIESLGGRVAGAVLNDPDAVAAHRNGYYAETAGASA